MSELCDRGEDEEHKHIGETESLCADVRRHGFDSSSEATSESQSGNIPHVRINDQLDTHVADPSDTVSLESDATADQTLSVLSTSVRSAATTSENGRDSAQASQKSYLSPLRSKRYDGLRSSLLSPHSMSRPGHLQAHSRTSSMASMLQLSELSDDHTIAKPREIVKWTRLRKISQYLHNEEGRRKYGMPTCLSVSGVLALGTSKGLLLIFDYQQTCKHVIGMKTKAATSGSVTALAISADHTKAVTGHEYGSLFTWDLRMPTAPLSYIAPLGASAHTEQGHREGSRVTHVGFIGTDQAAIISADISGMAFQHKCGSRLFLSSVASVRMLGRYPETIAALGLKPSTIYSLSVLPVGNAPHITDSAGIVAVLTPYKLVIISTKPVMRTQFKMSRPSGVLAEADTMSGAAAWYPASIDNDGTRESVASSIGAPVLAISWCRQIILLEISQNPTHEIDDPVPTALPRIVVQQTSKFTCTESIVQLQWNGSRILGALTRSSTLIFFDTVTWAILGNCDLLSRQILHHDIYEDRLLEYFKQREAEYVDQSFASAYSHSLQIYKGKVFVVGTADLFVGSFLNWADKLVAFISAGQHIEAIRLLVGYYDGTLQSRGSGLASDLDVRKLKIEPKLYETMLSSVKYSLSSEDLATRSDAYHEQLLSVCFEACVLLDNTSFLMDEIYEVYHEANRQELLLDRLAMFILDDQITVVPTSIIQDLVQWFISQNLHTRLEDIICHLEPSTLDINNIVHLCKNNALYNALIYVYTEALRDYTAPLVEFFDLIKLVLSSADHLQTGTDTEIQLIGLHTVNAVKVFSYLSLTLCGKIFPLAKSRLQDTSDLARFTVLNVLFSDSNIIWPPASGFSITTVMDQREPTFPYLRLLLRFDVPTLLASLDEAFEDSFLNAEYERARAFIRNDQQLITRQFIVNILLDVMSTDFDSEDVLYLYIFIARNVPKYPQFIVLSGTVLQKIIVGLCQYHDPEVADDCQLSVEYLLSVYRPANSADMVAHYREAGFYRVLKGVYRAEQRWSDLLLAHLMNDDDEFGLFDCIEEILGPNSGLTSKERAGVEATILECIVSIASLDGARTTDMVMQYLPHLQYPVYEALLGREGLLYIYLKRSFEVNCKASWIMKEVRETYIDLLCIYDNARLLDYLKSVDLEDIDVTRVIQNLEKYDLIDAVVFMMGASGKKHEALRKIVQRLSGLYDADGLTNGTVDAVLETKDKTFTTYTVLGCGLCQAGTLSPVEPGQEAAEQAEGEDYELMWIELLSVVIGTYLSSQKTGDSALARSKKKVNARKRVLRSVVQDTFSRFLVSSYSRDPAVVVRILRAWLSAIDDQFSSTQALQPILKDIFDSYQYYFQLLSLAESVLNNDLYQHVAEKIRNYRRGWKVTELACTICGKSVEDVDYQRYRFRACMTARQNAKLERRNAALARVMLEQGFDTERIKQETTKSNNNNTANGHAKLTDQPEHRLLAHKVMLISHACGHITHDECHKDHKPKNKQELVQCPTCDSENHNEPLPP